VTSKTTLVIRHLPDARRFAADIDGAIAYITYRELDGRILDFDHTFVPAPLRGGGIASQLTEHALRFARAGGFRIVPSCPFVAAYVARHGEHSALLA
jgi:predicted GNAT family acetyltransferase